METMYDKLGDLLNETLKSGQVKFKKKIKYSEKEIFFHYQSPHNPNTFLILETYLLET